MRWIASVLLLVALALGAAGCPHRQTGPAPAADSSWYRKENLFTAFDPNARDVSLVDAYLLELACFVGDKGTFELDGTLAAWGFTQRRDFRDIQTSTYGYVASNDRMVLVTFGGTDILNVRDILSDVDALQLVYDARYCATTDARVHRGFRDSLNSVIDGVIDEVRRQSAPSAASAPTSAPTTTSATAPDSRGATPPRKTLWVAGHSRGGAFAVLAAAAMARANDLPAVAGVYTFGQPRVGNGPFVAQLDSGPRAVRLFRFVNRDDPVPTVPIAAPPVAGRLGVSLDYQHAGTMVLLREDGRVVRASDADAGALSFDPRTAGASVANHYQPAYQAAIYAALSNPQSVTEPAWRVSVPPGATQALPAPPR
jgi:hypothetical protein